jgi:hypothetical protein
MTGLTMVVLLVFASFAVDLGFVRAVCGEMQHTADTAALAGASALYKTDEADVEKVTARASAMIERMQKSQNFRDMESQVIEVGSFNSRTGAFVAIDDPEASKPFAVRVRSFRMKTPLFFAAVIGHYSTDVSREAISVGSSPCNGIWGLRGVRVIGDVVTDSYHSEDGAYAADTADDNGDICSGRNVTLNGGVEINGDVMCGFGYEVNANGSSSEVTGLTSANSGPVSGPELDFGDVRFVNDNALIGLTDGGRVPWAAGLGANMSIRAGDNLNLPAGRYYLDSLTMRSDATITVSGPTTIYIGGDVTAAGAGIVSATLDPKDLSIISAGTHFSIGGSYDFYGSVLAPNADVVLTGDAGYYGVLIGGTVEMRGNTQVHVDESLPLADFFQPPPPQLVR